MCFVDINVCIYRYVAACWESAGASGRVQGTEKPTSLDECLASIIGNCLVSGVVPQRDVDSDLARDKAAVGESPHSCAQRLMPLGRLCFASEWKKEHGGISKATQIIARTSVSALVLV